MEERWLMLRPTLITLGAPEDVTMKDPISILGDSMDQMMFVSDLEDYFNINVRPQGCDWPKTMGELCERVEI